MYIIGKERSKFPLFFRNKRTKNVDRKVILKSNKNTKITDRFSAYFRELSNKYFVFKDVDVNCKKKTSKI